MRKALLVVLILSSVLSWAQGGCTGQKPLNGVTTGGFLKALSNQTVRVCTDTLNPCTLATIYSDAALTQSLSNPVTTDAAGNYQYCAAPGSYNEQVTSTGGVFAQVNNTPVTIGGSGDVLSSGNNSLTGINRAFLTPNYFYAADSFKMAMAMRAKVSWLLGTGSAAPQHHVIIGDSRQGLDPAALQAVAAQYGGINATGFVHFFSNIWGVPTYSIGASCVATRNDVTSTSTWGVAGSRLDCPSGQTVTIKPTYANDSVHIWYNQTSGGGSFTWAIDGGSTTTVNTTTAGADALGVVTITGLDATLAHSVALNVTAGSVRFYGMDFANSTQSGIIFDVLQSGSSQASMWNGHMGYAAQFIATVNPASVTFDLGTNDAGASFRTATQFATDLIAVVSGSALSATQAPIIMTQEQRGSSPGVPDATVNGLLAQYNQQIISLAKANNWSVFDAANYWPDYLTAYNAGMYMTETPQVHWTNFGALYMLGGLARNVFAPLADGLGGVNLTPAARVEQVSYASNGNYQKAYLYGFDHGINFNRGAGKLADQSICDNYYDKTLTTLQFSVCKDATNNYVITDKNGVPHMTMTTAATQFRHPSAGTTTMRTSSGTIILKVTDTGVTIGTNGTEFTAMIGGSGTLTFTAIAAQTCQEQTIAVTNASTTNFGVQVAPRATLGNTNLSWSAWVSVSGTVSVRVCNPTAGSITPSAVAWGVTVNQ